MPFFFLEGGHLNSNLVIYILIMRKKGKMYMPKRVWFLEEVFRDRRFGKGIKDGPKRGHSVGPTEKDI